jgi:hypothetical protein
MALTPEETQARAKAAPETPSEPAQGQQEPPATPVTSDSSHHVEQSPEPHPVETFKYDVAPPPERASRPGQLKEPPHSEEAEKGLLSSIIQQPKWAITIALQKIGAKHFYIPAHQTIFSLCIECFEAYGAFDLITLTQYSKDVGQADSVGGPPYLTHLHSFVPSALNMPQYIDIVRDKFALREMIRANTDFIARAREETNDVDALLREFGERAERVVKGAISGGSRLPALRDLSTLIGPNLPAKPAELVKGILHQGSKIIVGGTSKGRKTFALLDLAISVATGQPWWGFETVQGPVCYINFEIQEPFFAGRTQDICRAKGAALSAAAGDEPSDLVIPANMLCAWNLRGHGEGIENMVAELLFVLRLRPWVLIIFDPIYKALGGRDENKAGDVASMLNELERIAVHTGAAIGFGAHYSKGNQAAKESIDRIGGSGVFARDPDAILTMTPHVEEEHYTVDPTLRNFPPVKPFVVKWAWPLFTREDELDPDELKQPRKPKSGTFQAKYSIDDILDHLSVAQGIKPMALKNYTNTLRSMSRPTFYRLAAQLQKQNLLIEKEGEWFRATKKEQS